MDPSLSMHAYERLPLFTTGIVLGLWLIAVHAVMLVKATDAKRVLRRFPRNDRLGQIILGVGLIWFWLIVAQPGPGLLSSLAMDLGEQFNALKPLLKILVPISIVLIAISVKEFLAVRALGLLGLMAAAPLLESAFQKEPPSRLLVPVFAYAMIVASLYWVGMPYLFRDAVTWATASDNRWRLLCLAGLTYGIATLACALVFWRGY